MSDDIDFFISYTRADEAWAEWIAWTLERDGGYTTCLQLWDFPPGTNFALKMQDTAARSKHTIAVLSPAYLAAKFTGSEWAAAFVQDPQGRYQRLIPVMVTDCAPGGVLASIVSIHLMGLDEARARDALLQEVARRPGARPLHPPAFPGSTRPADVAPPPRESPVFPGPSVAPAPGSAAPAPTEAGRRTSQPEPTPEVPWTPLVTTLPVRWENVPRMTGAGQGSSRLELHVIPLPDGSPERTPLGPLTQGGLVTAGRQGGVFPAAATVDAQSSSHDVAAFLTDPTGSAMTGLRVGADGYRSGWQTLPLTAPSGVPAVVNDGLVKLLAAVTSLRPALRGQVGFAMAIRGAGRPTTITPGTSLSFRFLASHTRPVADDLARQLMEASADDQ